MATSLERLEIRPAILHGTHKVDPYYQWQKCSPVTLVSGNIRRMRIFMGGSPGRGRQMTVGLSTMVIFGDLGAYFFGKVRDKASNITWHPLLASN